MELFKRIDEMPRDELSPAAAYILRKARRQGVSTLYSKADEVFRQLEEKVARQGGSTLDGTGLYRTAVRVALVGLAEDHVAALRKEVLSWGFDEVAPIAGADLDSGPDEAARASTVAVPIPPE